METNFELVLARAACFETAQAVRNRRAIQADLNWLRCSVGEETVVKEFLPDFLQITARNNPRKSLTDDVIGTSRVFGGKSREHFQFGHAAKQWSNQRLDRNQRPVAGQCVTP